MSNTYKIHYQNKKIQVCLILTKYAIKIKKYSYV